MNHDFPSLAEQLSRKCVHFNGIQSKVCRAGMHYDDLKGTEEAPQTLPCITFASRRTDRPVADCALLRRYSVDEIEAEEKASAEAIEQYLGKMQRDICPHCDKPIARRKQVGRCVYAEPCGCRLYQGTVTR